MFFFNAPTKGRMIQLTKQDKPKKIKIPVMPSLNEEIANKKPKNPIWEPIHRAADSQIKRMSKQIIEATEETKRNINTKEMIEGVRNNDFNRIQASIPYDDYENGIRQAEDSVQIAFNDAGQGMIIHLPPNYRGVQFESTTERARAIIQTIGADLVRQVTDETRKAIRNEIDIALKEGLGADRTARNIIDSIGLTNRQARAANNFRKKLLENGVSLDKAEAEVKKYTTRMLKYRAENIARTELMKSANSGHMEMVRQGIDQDIIPRNVMKIWIVTPDDRLCDYCMAVEGQTVPINEPFQTPLGPVDIAWLHCSCRCVMGLVFPKFKAVS